MAITDTGATGSSSSSFRADIQGLRAVAVLLVVATHIFAHPAGGFIGVDVFFVISGFLITGLLVREREKSDRTSLRDFYARRARRILPMAVLVLLATDVAAHLIFSTVRARHTTVDSLWSMVFLANVHFASIGTSYFDALRPPSPVQQYWSLAVEEQFYLVWPCLLILSFFVARRVRVGRVRAVVGTTAVVTVVASFVYCLHATSVNPTTSYFSAPARAWQLGVGALAAIALPALARVPMMLRRGASWVGLALIILAAFVIHPTTPFPGSAAALPVFATALVLLARDPAGGVGARWALGNPVSLYLGRISYSVYLWHWPAAIFSKAYFGAQTFGFYAGSIVATLALSIASYHLVEEPVRTSGWLAPKPPRHLRDRRRAEEWVDDNRRVLVPLAICLVVLTAYIGVNVSGRGPTPEQAIAQARTEGASDDADAELTATIPTTAPPDALIQAIHASLDVKSWGTLTPSLDAVASDAAPEWRHDDCLDVEARKEAQCVYGSHNAPHLAVVVGDSVAVSYVPGIRAALPDNDWRVQLLTFHECPMLDAQTTLSNHRPHTSCFSHRQFALNEIQRLKPDLVISSAFFGYVDSFVGDTQPGDERNYQTWRDATTRTLSAMAPNAKHVVLLGSPPGAGNLQDCVTVRSNPKDCTRKVQSRWLGVRAADQAAATANGATYVDPIDWFCYHEQCPAVIGSTPVYWDGVHVTATYARTLAPKLAAALLPPP